MDYIPILRLGQIETDLVTDELSRMNVMPLLEVTGSRNYIKSLKSIKSHLGPKKYMVELPLYLSKAENKHKAGVSQLIADSRGTVGKSAQSNFYLNHKGIVPMPVISAEVRSPITSYNQISSRFQELADDFETLALRLFVGHLDLTEQDKNEIKTIFDIIRKDDLILLDVVEFEGLESGVMQNIGEIVAIKSAKNNKNKTYILNAFDIRNARCETRNYNPLLCKMFGLDGIGDLATISVWEQAGGRDTPTRIIRYYNGWEHKLVPFVTTSGSHLDSLRQLKRSELWKKAVDVEHVKGCKACSEADVTSNDGRPFWKWFRILHHVNSIKTVTLPMIADCKDPQDLDMDGYNTIFKKSGD